MNYLRAFVKHLWATLVVALVLLALYVSIGRQLMPLLQTHHNEIEQLLSESLKQEVRFRSLVGDWSGLSPTIDVQDLKLGGDGGIEVATLRLELNVLESLIKLLPVFDAVEVEGLHANVRTLADKRFELTANWVISLSDDKPQSDRPLWADLLPLQKAVNLKDVRIDWQNLQGERRRVGIEQLSWRSSGAAHELDAKLMLGDTEVMPMQVEAYLEGRLWPWEEQNGRIYLSFANRDWTPWLSELRPGFHFDKLEVSAEGWLKLEKGNLETLYLDVLIPNLQLSTPKQPVELSGGRLMIAGQRNGADWQVRLKPHFEQSLPFEDISLSEVKMDEQRGWQLGIETVDLELLREYLLNHQLLPAEALPYVEHIAPTGMAKDLRLSLMAPTDNAPWRVDLRAELQDLHSQAYKGIPALSGVDASLHLQPRYGMLRVANEELSLHLDPFYQQDWQIRDAKGVFRWAIFERHSLLRLEDFSAHLLEQGQAIPFHAALDIELPILQSAVEPSLRLLLSVPQAPISAQQQLVPEVAGDGLQTWLNGALDEGQVQDAMFALYTSLSSAHPPAAMSSLLALGFKDASLHYLDGWPEATKLDGRLLMNLPNLDIWVDRGSSLGGKLKEHSTMVHLRPSKQGNQLSLTAQIEGQSKEAIQYFTQTPLQQQVNHAFDQWRAQGPISASLALTIPLGSDGSPDIQLDAKLHNNELCMDDLKLCADKLNGDLRFSSSKGLSSPNLKGRIFSGDFTAKIRSKFTAEQQLNIVLEGQGQASWEGFRRWQPLFLFEPLTGELPYQAQLEINQGAKLTIESNLLGTHINLPAPFAKQSEQERELKVQLDAGSPLSLLIHYDNQLAAHLLLDAQGIDRGLVQIGELSTTAPQAQKKGLWVEGHIAQAISAKEWWQAWQRLSAQASKDQATSQAAHSEEFAQANPLAGVALKLDAVDVWGASVTDLAVGISQATKAMEIHLGGPFVQGKILMSEQTPLEVDLEYLRIPELPDDQAAITSAAPLTERDNSTQVQVEPVVETVADVEVEPLSPQERLAQHLAQDSLKDIDPSAIPELIFKAGEVSYLGRQFGRWHVHTHPLAQGTRVQILDSDISGLKLQGDLIWQLKDGVQHTAVQKFKVSSKDLLKVQQGFKMTPILEGKNSEAEFNLSWQGSPAALNSLSMAGDLSVQLKNGKVITEGADALKAFGVLNLNSLTRRLKLDFSDLYQSGVAFDLLRAKATITNGVMTLSEPLLMDGPGGKFLISGWTNLIDHDVDMKLVVTFPVASNLPLVVILAGFAPPIAASIYVTEKLIGDELSRFTSASYNITGTWEEPNMEINSLFDNKVEGSKSRTLKQRIKSLFFLGD